MKLFILILTLLHGLHASAVPGMDTLGDLRRADAVENGQPRHFIHTELILRKDLVLGRSRNDRALETQSGQRYLSARVGSSCMARAQVTSSRLERIRLLTDSQFRLDSTSSRRFQNNQVFISDLLNFAPWEDGQVFVFVLSPRNKEITERIAGDDRLDSLSIYCKYLGPQSSLIEAEVMMGLNFHLQW